MYDMGTVARGFPFRLRTLGGEWSPSWGWRAIIPHGNARLVEHRAAPCGAVWAGFPFGANLGGTGTRRKEGTTWKGMELVYKFISLR